MLKAAIAHKGTVMLDVISPCVTFNDHEGSTKSYKFMQEHDEPINEIGFVASFEDIEVDYDSGQVYDVEMHDGSSLRLRKLREDYDPTNKSEAVRTLMEAHEQATKSSPACSTSRPRSPRSSICSTSWMSRWPRCPSRSPARPSRPSTLS